MQFRFRPLHAAILAAAVLGIAGFLYGIGFWAATPPKPFVLGAAPKPLPEIGFADAAGVRHTLAAYRGRYVLVNFWATYCAPCVAELPALAGLKRAVADVAVLAVDVENDPPQVATAFLKDHGASGLETFVDGKASTLVALKAYYLPVTILIDPQGREIGRAMGAVEWNSAKSVAYFRALKIKSAP